MSIAIKSKNMNICLTEKEYDVIKKFADVQGQTISALILDTLREKIEDWEDVKECEEVVKNCEKKISWEELQSELSL